MKLNDIINEESISEIPVGVGSTIKTAIKSINPFSVSGRNQAQGQLVTGKQANQIYGEFYKWLGQTGKPADSDTVIEFLKQNGYGSRAVAAAQNAISKLAVPTSEATDRVSPLTHKIPTTAPATAAPTPKQVTPLVKQDLNAIFLAVAQSAPPQQSQQQPRQNVQPAGQPSPASTSYGTSNRSTSAAPTIDIPSIVAYYKSLPDDDSRNALRVQLDQADGELAKAANPDPDAALRENAGFSRFLGIDL